MIAVDTSVAVARALPWHEAHHVARDAVGRHRPALIGHVALETYSVLTRLPGGQRVPAEVAREYLDREFESPPVVLSGAGYNRLFDVIVRSRITGGAAYDAIVAATALEAGLELLSLDRRAMPVYRAVGAGVVVVG